jgi:hypothetical protein
MAEVGGSYKPALTVEQQNELRRIAEALVMPGKGLLAADESTGKCSSTSKVQHGSNMEILFPYPICLIKHL